MYSSLLLPIFVALFIGSGPVGAATPMKPYSCKNQFNICRNICFYMGCAHPADGKSINPALVTHSGDKDNPGLPADRRVDCGATHTPPPFQPTNNKGLGLPNNGTSPDEFPFASSTQGGLTPHGDGAGLLGVPPAEQKSQGGVVRKFWNSVPVIGNNEDAYIMLQDTAGITYCDENAPTPGSVFCDGGLFTGVHFLKSDNVYCQWAIGPDPTKCYDGKTGKVVPRPSSAVAHVVVTNTSIPEGYFQMLHVQYPDLARAMWNEVTDGPMPPGYTPITSIEQWLSMNRTAAIMPPRR